MLAKLTVRNQITIPKEVMKAFGGVSYFDVREEDGRVVMEPRRRSRADEVREKLLEYGVSPDNVKDAITWSRETRPRN